MFSKPLGHQTFASLQERLLTETRDADNEDSEDQGEISSKKIRKKKEEDTSDDRLEKMPWFPRCAGCGRVRFWFPTCATCGQVMPSSLVRTELMAEQNLTDD